MRQALRLRIGISLDDASGEQQGVARLGVEAHVAGKVVETAISELLDCLDNSPFCHMALLGELRERNLLVLRDMLRDMAKHRPLELRKMNHHNTSFALRNAKKRPYPQRNRAAS